MILMGLGIVITISTIIDETRKMENLYRVFDNENGRQKETQKNRKEKEECVL